jgi:cyclopropane-fatty-acyl-phospholipid synthase
VTEILAADYAGASPAAIQFHYDAGDAFFRLWLGPSMTYTAARFPDDAADAVVPDGLDAAQRDKLRFHLAAVGAAPGARILDIGCGWGTLMRGALSDYGAASATGLTLSADQLRFIEREPDPRLDVRLESYEHFVPAHKFDGIVSVGAFEHFAKPSLGAAEKRAAYRRFFSLCHGWLVPGGRLSLQTIAWGDIEDGEEAAIPLQQFFPDSNLPHVEEVVGASRRHFELLTFENRRRDYELTLRCWLANLRRRKEEALALVGREQYDFYDRCLQGGTRLFQRRKYYLCRFVFRRLGRPALQAAP